MNQSYQQFKIKKCILEWIKERKKNKWQCGRGEYDDDADHWRKRGRWYDNDWDSDKYNSITIIGGDGEETNTITNTIKIIDNDDYV